jgi:hypothetical protein
MESSNSGYSPWKSKLNYETVWSDLPLDFFYLLDVIIECSEIQCLTATRSVRESTHSNVLLSISCSFERSPARRSPATEDSCKASCEHEREPLQRWTSAAVPVLFLSTTADEIPRWTAGSASQSKPSPESIKWGPVTEWPVLERLHGFRMRTVIYQLQFSIVKIANVQCMHVTHCRVVSSSLYH